MTKITSGVMALSAISFFIWGVARGASDEIHLDSARVLESAEENYESIALEIYRLAELGYFPT